MDDLNEKQLKRALSFDLYGRHAIVREIIDAHREENEKFSVLDIGGRGNILKNFLTSDHVSFLDPYADEEERMMENYIAGDGCKLPLEDQSFDWVVSLDVLEHIPAPDRDKFINENLRVASRGVILVAPFFSKGVAIAEKNANENYKILAGGQDHPWLVEHLANTLPHEKTVENFLKKNGYQFRKLFNNDLRLWDLLIGTSFLVSFHFSEEVQKSYFDFNEFYNTEVYPNDFASSNSYRKIYFILKKPEKRTFLVHPRPIDDPLFFKVKRENNRLVYSVRNFLQVNLLETQERLRSLDSVIHTVQSQLEKQQRQIQKKSREIIVREKELIQQKESVRKLRERVFSAEQQNHLLTRELQEIRSVAEREIERANSLNARVQYMESSKFWKLRNYYLRFRSYPHLMISRIFGWRIKDVDLVSQSAPSSDERITHGTEAIQQDSYVRWIARHEQYDKEEVQEEIAQWQKKPLISILTPVYNTNPEWLDRCIQSVKDQYYSNWELCLYDDGSKNRDTKKCLAKWEKKDERIHVRYGKRNLHICGASNEALSFAHGTFVVLLDHDDELSPNALFEIVKAYNQKDGNVDFIYSDEDKLNLQGQRVTPFFKPDWSPDLFLSMMYTAHLGAYRRSLVREIGGFREGYEGAQDYDLILRLMEKTTSQRILHIPKILYHWRQSSGSTSLDGSVKTYAQKSALQALSDYLDQNHIEGVVQEIGQMGRFRVKRKIQNPPLVSIIIPFRDKIDVLKRCVDSILQKTDYSLFEILLINNQSCEEETEIYLQTVVQQDSRIRILQYDHAFNYSAINNFGANKSLGSCILLLNNDTEVLSSEWLSAMVEHIQRPEVAIVGAKLIYPQNEKIQHAGVVLGIGGVAGHAFKSFDRDAEGYFSQAKVIRNCSAVTGACLLVKKDVFSLVGGLEEKNLPIAFNDVDLCLKVRDLGYLIVWTPYALLYHYESLSRGDDERFAKGNQEEFKRVLSERDYMLKKWGALLNKDPYYNINLTLKHENYALEEKS